MTYINPKISSQFESLSIDLKNAILEQNVDIHSMTDLMNCLENIVNKG